MQPRDFELFPQLASPTDSLLSATSSSLPFHDSVLPKEPLIRRTSSKRRRPGWRSSLGKNQLCTCVLPDRPKSGQRMFLDKMPTEILLDIFEFAFMSPITPARCEHQPKVTSPAARISRRATENSFFLQPPSTNTNTNTSAPSTSTPDTTASTEDPDEPLELSDSLRIFRAKTLLNITLTCRRFFSILSEDPGTDLKLWRSAARWCWDWLPASLSDVQGRNLTSQTSWRNLVAVFMRSENGLFGKKGGGRGGVESFGGKKRGIPATPYSQWKPSSKKLLLVVAQPGPDIFTATPDPNGRSWTISLSVRGGADYLVHLDEHGRFGPAPARLPGGLKRPDRTTDHFPPDLFEVEGDRTQIVKAALGDSTSTVQESVVWDLSAIPEFVADPKARVARCVSHDQTLLCNLFTHGPRDPGSLDDLLDPPEDPRLFCLDTSGLRWSHHPPPHPTAASFPPAQDLHPVLTSLALSSTHAAALIRWNIRTPRTPEELVSRAFHILCPRTGTLLRVMPFPNLYWDFRHHDMAESYTRLRHQKLTRLYNHLGPADPVGAGNRATRIHADAIFLTPTALISGSHDYCTWLWPLPPAPAPAVAGVYTPTRNDAGGPADPFTVLDDYYWGGEGAAGEGAGVKGAWTSAAERAGWWVRTPNQVLCYWHAIALSHAARAFAAVRPGKLFLWDLSTPTANDSVRAYTAPTEGKGKRAGWLGALAPRARALRHRVKGWFVCDDVMPAQALWMVCEDGEAVYLDREEVLKAAVGGRGQRREWVFWGGDFEFQDDGDGGGEGEEGGKEERRDSGAGGWSEEDEEEGGLGGEEAEGSGTGAARKRRRTGTAGWWEGLDADGAFRFEGEEEEMG
ncbi:hypothetical protein EDC01DRAFT_613807 [Geopyxis carbonaria]|nr:hypothetical protein EDC01DRAFT_613807 [Geopyxis carbonaria]